MNHPERGATAAHQLVRKSIIAIRNQISKLAKVQKITLDSRANGPARAAFMFAGGLRPERFGSTNASTVHHVYSGKFPYINRAETTHAVKLRNHFTQSAGVVATHPVADALCDEYPFFAWLLRFEAFRRFLYDPDRVFSPRQDALGFAEGHQCEIMFVDSNGGTNWRSSVR